LCQFALATRFIARRNHPGAKPRGQDAPNQTEEKSRIAAASLHSWY
jgi:hypothetical protein